MELAPLQQAAELIRRGTNILVCLPVKPSSDAIASGLALFLTLEKLGKRTKVVCSDFELPSNHTFLPKSEAIERELKNLRQFIITLDVSKAAVEELSYGIEKNQLNIFVTPKNGFYQPSDITTNAGNYAFDAVITIGAADLEELGGLAKDNAEFFFAVPVVNIDHQAKNSRFGQVNVIDVTAASNAEIVFECIRSLGFNVLDDQVATSLLTGIIAKTKSFQSPTVTPRSLAVASHLISAGAKREEIIDHLFQSKSIASLKLWGRALARLQSDPGERLVWSVLSDQDFIKSGASEDDLPGAIDELIMNVPSAELIVIIYARAGQPVRAVIGTTKGHDLAALFVGSQPFGSTTNLAIWEIAAAALPQAEEAVLQVARQAVK